MPSVLLIDDNAVQLRAREAVLRGAGFQVAVATSAAGALALVRSGAQTGHLDAVVTDHIMPGASGAEFVRQLRAVSADVPVLVISGMAEAERDYAGLNVAFRQKPVPPEELIGLVGRLAAGD